MDNSTFSLAIIDGSAVWIFTNSCSESWWDIDTEFIFIYRWYRRISYKTGKVVGTDFTYTNVDVLRPAEKSSFEIILTDLRQSQKVSSYKLSVSGDKAQPLPASLKLSIGDSHLDGIGFYHVVGEVTNEGSGKATFVKVSGTFYNSSGSAVAADFTYTDPKDIEPGQTAPFEMVVTSAATADEIAYASVNVGSDQYSSVI